MLGLLLGLDEHVLDYEWLDQIGIDDLLVLGHLPREIDQRLLRIYDDVDHPAVEVPAYVLGAHLLKLGLSVVDVDLDLALDEEIPTLLDYPLAVAVADADAEMDEIGVEEGLAGRVADLDRDVQVALLVNDPREGLGQTQLELVLSLPEDLPQDGLLRGEGEVVEFAVRLQGHRGGRPSCALSHILL
jgi:hypothetical protein